MFGASFLFETQEKPKHEEFRAGVLEIPKFFMLKFFVCYSLSQDPALPSISSPSLFPRPPLALFSMLQEGAGRLVWGRGPECEGGGGGGGGLSKQYLGPAPHLGALKVRSAKLPFGPKLLHYITLLFRIIFPDYVKFFTELKKIELVSNYFLGCVISCVVTKHTMWTSVYIT